MSDVNAAKLRTMMESVVSSHGTAPTAAIPGYRVAGKTGTAQRVDPMTGKYSGYTASFIGFAPADTPRFVISVTLQRPRNGHFGGSLCGPVFKKVMTFVLQSKHVAPTGTEVARVALTQVELKKMERDERAKATVKTNQASVNTE
jgi:cell division protein FtsI (penicillin-binding protein 3)